MTKPTFFVEALDAAIAANGLTHLTLFPTADGKWQASYKSASADSGYSVSISIDPECALIGALVGNNSPDKEIDLFADDADLIG